jgi:S1-C subfamily serine protease
VILSAVSVAALLLLPTVGVPDGVAAAPEAIPSPTTPAAPPPSTSTSTVPPVTTVAPTTTTSTTAVPRVEALIPITVDALRQDVAASVGFVLTQQGTGSGVIISEDLLVTNAHVAWPGTTVSLVFLNGATHQGRVLAVDPFVDLAVIDISGLSRKPPPIVLGSTADMAVNDPLWVVGYPLPSEFTPEPTVDAGTVLGFSDWEFTGVRWFTVDAPAIGGQSGGAVVDEFGRLVGISTFGSAASLTSIGIDDVLTRVDALLEAEEVRGLDPRTVPRGGGRRTLDVSLEGEWDQQLFLGWLPGSVEVTVAGSGVNLAARTIGGEEIASGSDLLEFIPGSVFPVIIAAAGPATNAQLAASLPFISFEDPDHGKTLEREGMTAGVYDVGHDRDFFYLELTAGETASVTIESAARTHLWVYDPDGALIAEDIDNSGFIRNNASVDFTSLAAGRYIIALESSLSTISGYTVVTR